MFFLVQGLSILQRPQEVVKAFGYLQQWGCGNGSSYSSDQSEEVYQAQIHFPSTDLALNAAR
jgi:hypothetical protein